ncbi:MAG: HAD family hydrolase [Sutterellaceae bacterium]|nr:HAD-IB family hydrolase [Burkholderiaceae bacterium]MDW8429223.1 HAD family hydrolase [Sutterellaceae bacterium]
MKLALFDLDHTLLPIDSASAWSRFVVARAGLDTRVYGERIRAFAAAYRAGNFDVEAYLAFQLDLLARFPRARLEQWRARFVADQIAPHVRPPALALIARHRAEGYELALVTGTNAFVTAPIAALFGIDHLLAVQPEEVGGRFTGRYVGTHTYRQGKVQAVEAFLAARGTSLADCADSVFYSDSINDLPLLERVRRPVATNADEQLRAVAAARRWPMLELFAAVPTP